MKIYKIVNLTNNKCVSSIRPWVKNSDRRVSYSKSKGRHWLTLKGARKFLKSNLYDYHKRWGGYFAPDEKVLYESPEYIFWKKTLEHTLEIVEYELKNIKVHSHIDPDEVKK